MKAAGYVNQPAQLREVCAVCGEAAVLGLDTEFERSRTYYPRPALVQVAVRDAIWLVDPLALRDLGALGKLIADCHRVTVMHGAQEDLEVLAIATGCQPGNLFDTQLAAALAGHRAGLGYHALVKDTLGLEVRKDQTRSNWLRRPLSPDQLRYACTDVAHLLDLHRSLDGRLRELGREDWFREEMRRLSTPADGDGLARDYLRLVARVEDDDRTRGALLDLCRWREAEARRRDCPRRHLLDDPLLLDLARHRPASLATLETLESWQAHRGRARAEAVLAATARATRAPGLPIPPEAADLSPHRHALGAMKRVVADTARALDLDTSVLASRRLLEKAVVHTRVRGLAGLPEEFRGWRAAYLEGPLTECLRDG